MVTENSGDAKISETIKENEISAKEEEVATTGIVENQTITDDNQQGLETEGKPSNPDLIRSKRNGCFLITNSEAWGRCIIPTEDPEGKDFPPEFLDKFFLNNDFPKVPQNLWAAIMSLFFELCDPNNKTIDATAEVSIVFCRKIEGGYRDWRVLVPTQEVDYSKVNAKFEKLCDILTGEETVLPPEGYVHSGSAHSHNHMGAFFSGTDNDNELSVPGLHVVVGKIDTKDKKYELKASIVLRGKRYDIEAEEVIDLKPAPVPFHPNVRKYITKKTWGSSSSSSTTTSSDRRTKFTYDEIEYAFLLREDPIEMINGSVDSNITSTSTTPITTSVPNTPAPTPNTAETSSDKTKEKCETVPTETKPTEPKKEVPKTDSFFDQPSEIRLSPSDRRKLHQIRSLTAELIQKTDCKDLIREICSYYYFGRDIQTPSLAGHDTGWQGE